ncbi:26S proteasome non-ATPase regulatory subunit 12 [Zancudomyces culisetae]|uniref:26S proteasome non-ATPase regulatory subunit 12 n=1 Tax=Zancudomyces culisetae TaxID=1213189 RepID=A0A1R1PZ19_ZANCU|nr:26S proteasome non-ATPase regulatory subunit 12 [Zancudomyces culisetae]|eukprot:OMH86181.1 26S proteasome non-ATPase regulatory subunit 12 [Zancudomyces culisetae]
MLSEIKEGQGKVGEACDIMLEDQIETFGSLNKREKTEFILEQLRLCMAKGDYERAVIVSRKINVSYFKTPNTGDLKLRYYYLMIQYGIHEEQYLEVCKHYYNVFETDEIKLDNKWVVVVQHMVVYAILASYSNEQVDLLNRIKQLSSELEKLPIYSNLLKLFTTQKLISWDKFSTDFLHTLVQSDVFSEQTEGGKIRSTRLHNCVVEHNIRVIASYYSKITLTRLSQLIGLDIDQAEEKVCHLVVTKVIYARIDRPSKIVSFLQPKSVDQELNEWVSDVNSLLMLVEKTSHLIDKEGIVTSITRTL